MVKKELICLLVFLIFLSFIPFVNAGSIGISPTNFEFFFEPNLEKTFDFTVSNANPEAGIEVYVVGDLAPYVKLSEDYFVGKGIVTVSLKLPSTIDVPGKHRILIGARESAGKDIEENAGGVGGIAAIQAVIEVYVPYPGKYIESEFNINNINKGETAYFDLTINNLGTEKITINPLIEIYEGEKKLKSKTIEIGELQSKEKRIVNDFLETSDLREGIYKILVTLDYGKIMNIEKELRVGYFFVNITDYSNRFIKGKINPFEINIENLWNSEMKNVYAEVVITDSGKVLTSFKTPSVTLSSWENKNLTGFFDASDIIEGKYTANIQVFYEGKMNTKLVAVYVVKPEINWILVIIIGGVVGFILITLIVITYLIIKIRRLKKDVKKSKK